MKQRVYRTGRRKAGGLREAAAIIIVNFLWALCYPVLTVAVIDTSPLSLAFARSLIAGVTLLLIGVWLKRPLPSGKEEWGYLFLIGLTITGFGFGGMFMAGGRVSPGIATVLANSQPILALVFGAFLLREKPRILQVAGMIVGFFGIVLIIVPDLLQEDTHRPLGIGYVIGGAVGVALGNVFLKKISARIDAIMAIAIQFLFGSAILALAGTVLGVPLTSQWSLASVSALLVLAWPGTALVFVIWYWLLQHSELSRVNTFTFLTPVFALGMGSLFFHERLGSFHIAGIIIILCGVSIAGRTDNGVRSGMSNRLRAL